LRREIVERRRKEKTEDGNNWAFVHKMLTSNVPSFDAVKLFLPSMLRHERVDQSIRAPWRVMILDDRCWRGSHPGTIMR